MNLRELKKESLRINLSNELRYEIGEISNDVYFEILSRVGKRTQLNLFDISKNNDLIRTPAIQGAIIDIFSDPIIVRTMDLKGKIIGIGIQVLEQGQQGSYQEGFYQTEQELPNRGLILVNPLYGINGIKKTEDILIHEFAHVLDPAIYSRRGEEDKGYYERGSEILAHITEITDRIAKKLLSRGLNRQEALNYVASYSLGEIVSENWNFFESFLYGRGAKSPQSMDELLSSLFGGELNSANKNKFYKDLYNAINSIYDYQESEYLRNRRQQEDEWMFYSDRTGRINLRNLKNKIAGGSNEIYMIHVKSKDPDLGEVEYWKSGPKTYDVRPRGWKDCLGSIIEFQDSYIIVDEPDDQMYPTVEDGVHALVSQHEKRCKEQRQTDMRPFFEAIENQLRLASKTDPEFKTLKKNKKTLTEEERQEVKDLGAEWSDGHPAIMKSEIDGETYYTAHTHRAYQTRKSIPAAAKAFHDFIKSTAGSEGSFRFARGGNLRDLKSMLKTAKPKGTEIISIEISVDDYMPSSSDIDFGIKLQALENYLKGNKAGLKDILSTLDMLKERVSEIWEGLDHADNLPS